MIKNIFLFLALLVLMIACNSQNVSDTKDSNQTQKLFFTPEQRLIADQYISIFENATTVIKYDYASDIGDGRGITAGRAGFNSATGGMLIVIEKYTKIKPDNSLSKYIVELKRLNKLYADNGYTLSVESANTSNLVGLKSAWVENASFSEFRKVQDDVVDELYFTPALEEGKKLGLKMPLSLLSLYDTQIQHGKSGLSKIVAKATQMTGGLTPKSGADELEWLRNFNNYRKEVLNSNPTLWGGSTKRVDKLIELIDAKNTELRPFELRIKYPNHPTWSDDVYYLPA